MSLSHISQHDPDIGCSSGCRNMSAAASPSARHERRSARTMQTGAATGAAPLPVHKAAGRTRAWAGTCARYLDSCLLMM